jgi:hypothetical protein
VTSSVDCRCIFRYISICLNNEFGEKYFRQDLWLLVNEIFKVTHICPMSHDYSGIIRENSCRLPWRPGLGQCFSTARPSSYKKRIYRATISQSLRTTGLRHEPSSPARTHRGFESHSRNGYLFSFTLHLCYILCVGSDFVTG